MSLWMTGTRRQAPTKVGVVPSAPRYSSVPLGMEGGMTTEQDNKNFQAEFEALKAKYGEAFADLVAVRFTRDGVPIPLPRAFIPYSCRADDEGFIHCEEERPV